MSESEIEQVRENAHAVVIGINEYEDPRIPNLTFARADAEEVYKILIDPKLGGFSPDNVSLLLDGDATERRIRTAIGRDVRRQAGKADLVYIYYAGHGSAEIDPKCRYQDGLEKYLVPADAELDNLFSTGIAMEDIQKFFERIEARQIIFFIDSCYSGEAGGRTFRNPNFQKRAAMTTDFLDGMSGEGRLVVTACDVNEVSLETNEAGHGLFTYYLAEGLKGAADKDQDGLVTTQELYDYIFENVSRHAREIGGSMNPIQKGFLKGKVFLTRYETEAQKKAKDLHAQAFALFSEQKYEQAYALWQEVIQLVPGHAEAKKGLSAIEGFREKQERRRQRLLEKQQSRLLSLYYSSKLSADELNFAIELVKKGKEGFTERERKIYKLINELASEKISPEVYVECVNLVRREGQADIKQDESTERIRISKTEASLDVESSLQSGVLEEPRSSEVGEVVSENLISTAQAAESETGAGIGTEPSSMAVEEPEGISEGEVRERVSREQEAEKSKEKSELKEMPGEWIQTFGEGELEEKAFRAKWIELPVMLTLWIVLGWMMLQVILRYLLGIPLLTDFMPLIVLAIALLSAAITEGSDMHISMPFAEMLLPKQARRKLKPIADIIKIVTYAFTCIILVDVVTHKEFSVGLVDFPWIKWVGPIAFGVMALYSIGHIIRRIRMTKRET